MANKVGCQYTVVRYVHDPISNEPVNLGIILRSTDQNLARAKFLSDLRAKLPRTATTADFSTIHAYFEQFNKDLDSQDVSAIDHIFKLSGALDGGRIQLTEPRGIFSVDPMAELDRLYKTYVGITEVEKVVRPQTKTRFRQDLKKFFRTSKFLGRKGKEGHFLEPNLEVMGDSGVKHRLDYGMKNSKLVVVESVDLTRKNTTHDKNVYKSAVILDEMKKAWKKSFTGFSVVCVNDGASEEVKRSLKLLKNYSDVYAFDPDETNASLKKNLQEALD